MMIFFTALMDKFGVFIPSAFRAAESESDVHRANISLLRPTSPSRSDGRCSEQPGAGRRQQVSGGAAGVLAGGGGRIL